MGLLYSGACGSSSVVERLLAKEEVASSTLVFRSIPLLSALPAVAAPCTRGHPDPSRLDRARAAGLPSSQAEVAELADAMVSKTVGPPGPCRFESGLRHQPSPTEGASTLPGGVTVAHGPLKPLVGVRIPARQVSRRPVGQWPPANGHQPSAAQNTATGLTAPPVPPCIGRGWTQNRNSQRPSRSHVSASASRSQLSMRGRPMAVTPMRWTGMGTAS